MKIALLSDVHSNAVAFRLALEDVKTQVVQKVLLLGDVVGYGDDPVTCIKLAKDNCTVILKGNHDAALVGEESLSNFIPHAQDGILHNRGKVSEEDRNWLKSIQYLCVCPQWHFVATHGSVFAPEKFFYNDDPTSKRIDLNELKRFQTKTDTFNIIFCAHTHKPDIFGYEVDTGTMNFPMLEFDPNEKPDQRVFDLDPKLKYVINVGSVGYPRVEGRSTYVIYDTDLQTVTFRYLPFDVQAYAKRLEAAQISLPFWVKYELERISKTGEPENGNR